VSETDGTDESLVARAMAGDEDAYAALLRRHAMELRRLVDRRLSAPVRRKVSVEDVLQEAHLTAFQRLPDFEDRGEGSFLRWLRKIADHKAQSAVERHAGAAKRAVSREVTRGARPDTGALEGPAPDPSQAAIRSEENENVRRAMEAISEDHREVLRLATEEGLTLRQIAARMGRSREAVKKLYGRALGRFTEEYGRGVGGNDAGHA